MNSSIPSGVTMMLPALLLLLASSLASAGDLELHSSVWCLGGHSDHRHCQFQNLCYSPSHAQFVFFHSASESSLSGVDAPDEQRQLARLAATGGAYLDYVGLPREGSKTTAGRRRHVLLTGLPETLNLLLD